jgi:[histone H3]-trimethyl-L-lysine4 demethylase
VDVEGEEGDSGVFDSDSSESSLEEATDDCEVCKKRNKASSMLACDGCDRGFHMFCLNPPVKRGGV